MAPSPKPYELKIRAYKRTGGSIYRLYLRLADNGHGYWERYDDAEFDCRTKAEEYAHTITDDAPDVAVLVN